MKRTVSKEIEFREGTGYLHGFSTGTVKVKSKFRTAKGGQLLSKINFLIDKKWTEEMPILVWVIDHPEGVFVVDTGENANVTQPDYFKQEGFILESINKKSFRFNVSPKEEVGNQLKKLGYEQKDISKVILTHLHLDHFDGLSFFDETPILVHDKEWKNPSFALPSLYPEWFVPEKVKLNINRKNKFEGITNLTESKEIAMIHTPGHTNGHCSVLIKTKDIHYLLAGDVTYNQTQLIKNINAGGHQSFKKSRNTFKKIKEYGRENNLIYLPSHDNNSLNRVTYNEILKL